MIALKNMACSVPTVKYPEGRTGTDAGYQAHLNLHEGVCPPCREANRLKSEKNNRDPRRQALRRVEYENNREAYAARNLARYGLTVEQYDQMLTDQGGACAICRSFEPGGRGRFHVDHDHYCCPGAYSCGECVRGLLCAPCNVGLGGFRDNPELLIAAAAHLMTSRDDGGCE